GPSSGVAGTSWITPPVHHRPAQRAGGLSSMVKLLSRGSTVYCVGRANVSLVSPHSGSTTTLCWPSTAPWRFLPSRNVVSTNVPSSSISPTAASVGSDTDRNSIRPSITGPLPFHTTLPLTG